MSTQSNLMSPVGESKYGNGAASAACGSLRVIVILVLHLLCWPSSAATLPEPISAVPGLKLGGDCPDAGKAGSDALAAASMAVIPLKVGLTLSAIWKRQENDYEHECLDQIASIDARGILVKHSCPLGPSHELKHFQRLICWADFLQSSIYVTQLAPAYPDTFPGSLLFSLSIASFVELKTRGGTGQRLVQPNAQDPSVVDEDIPASLKSDGKSTFKLIVNEKVVEMPSIEAASIKQNQIVRIKVLDDAHFPLLLDYYIPTSNKFYITYTKVSYPTPHDLENSLAVDKHVDIYGIYFDFASATLRAESEPVLHEIADALRTHVDWHLLINGHTDNIGTDAQNLELSRQRAFAVRAALVSRFQIDGARLGTNGLGASQPKESNETVSGRARNRRVELVRQ